MGKIKETYSKFIYITISLICLFVLVGSGFASAASSPAMAKVLDIQISPLPITLTAKPGTSVTTNLRVRNAGSTDEELKITLQKVTQPGPNGVIEIGKFPPGDPLPSWVHFETTVFNAPPGEWLTIPMTINLPPDAAYGYYFGVQFQLANPLGPEAGKATIQGAADIFVLLNAVSPGEVTKVELSTFSVDHKTYEFLPVNFKIRVHNTGNIDTAPYGNIFIEKGKKVIDTLNVNNSQNSVLPGSYKLYTASWSDGFPVYKNVLDVNGQPVVSSKNGQVERKLIWNFNNITKLRFGHYTAKLVLIYNNGTSDIPITSTASFWIIPWRIIGAIVFIIGLIIFLSIYVVTLRRRIKKISPRKKYKMQSK